MITETAYAKINFFLEIAGKREDGYHEVKTVLQTISISDTVILTKSDSPDFECNAEELLDENNICLEAARLFSETYNTPMPSIKLRKHIPWGAGLGGGSSDAAAVLRGMRTLYALSVDDDELEELGAKLGADVPFFIRGGTQYAEGIGEKLTPITHIPGLFIVVCEGKERMSTTEAYALIDGAESDERRSPDGIIGAINGDDGDSIEDLIFNRFETITPKDKRYELMSDGAVAVMLCGSGSAVFGIYPSKSSAEKTQQKLRSKGYHAFRCETI